MQITLTGQQLRLLRRLILPAWTVLVLEHFLAHLGIAAADVADHGIRVMVLLVIQDVVILVSLVVAELCGLLVPNIHVEHFHVLDGGLRLYPRRLLLRTIQIFILLFLF